MREIIHQLFINKFKVRGEIENIQSQTDFTTGHNDQQHLDLIDSKHKDWDRIEHLLDLCFKSLGC